jgi:enoyl-[acyl-carrier-protein] reductase (NADH)
MTIKNLSTNDLERIILESPLKRLVTLEEVVSVVLEVVTGKFSGMTGQEIILDGGWGVSKLV